MSDTGRSRLQGGVRMREGEQRSLPLITVVTAVYNGAQSIEQTIQSVLNQTYDAFEFIVIDGGSNDGTVDILRQYDDRINYWLSELDSGIYDAWNKGIASARGEWVAFLGSDDAYYEHALERYASFIADNRGRDYEYISSRVDFVTQNLERIKVIGTPWEWSRFCKKMNVAHVGSLHHRSLYERYGTYDTTYKITGDYELLLRPRNTLRAGFLDNVTAFMRNGGMSFSMVRAFAEAKRAKHHAGGRSSMLCTLDNAVDMTKILVKKMLLRKYRS